MASANGQEKKIVSLRNESGGAHSKPSWIDQFVERLQGITSPDIFKTWAGIAAIAGVLERRVWMVSMGSRVYPNMFIALVAPPGVGKTEVIWRVGEMWKSVPELYVAPSSLTKAAFIDELADAKRDLPPNDFNSLLVPSNELGTLLPAYEREFMAVLTDLWDGKGYGERRRTRKIQHDIPRPCVNILAGCTPGYLKETIPPGAWDEGFLSRVLLIYSGEKHLNSLFNSNAAETSAFTDLSDELSALAKLSGEVRLTREAAEFLDAWYLGGQVPVPDHPRLHNYTQRRILHIEKLAMVCAVADRPDLLIEKHHILRALDYLVEAEEYMPDIFKAMSSGGDQQVIEDTYHFIYKLYMKGKQPISAGRVYQYLMSKVPSHNIPRVIEVMKRANLIREITEEGKGTVYKPLTYTKR